MENNDKWIWAKPTHPFNPSQKAAVKVENGYIFYSELWEPYFPFDFPNLPNKFAKVDNGAAVIDFVEKYGILGHSAFFPDMEIEHGSAFVYKKGDPIDWFIGQAKTVRFALNLINAIQNKDDQYIKKFIKDSTVKVPLRVFYEGAPEDSNGIANVFAIGSEIQYSLYPGEQELWQGKQKLLAMQMVNFLVNSNSKGVSRLLRFVGQWSPEKPYKFTQEQSSRSLIEAIWFMVGNAALLSQEIYGKGVRTCKECGLPFIVTDKRQKFCPGDEFSSGSLCGNRARVRKTRQKKEDDK